MKALAIDAEEALLDYLDMFYNLRRAGRALRKMGAIDFATTIAPGLRDVLITGKIKEAVTPARDDGRPVYDAVVIDAPPTGRITRFLNVTAEMAQLARSGPIKTQSDGVMARPASPADGGAPGDAAGGDAGPGDRGRHRRAHARRGCPSGSVVVNMATEPALPPAELRPGGRRAADRRRARPGPRRRRTCRAGRRRRRRAGRRGRPTTPGAWACAGRAAGRRRGAGPAHRGAAADGRADGPGLACSSRPAGSRTTCATEVGRVSAARTGTRRPGVGLGPARPAGTG